MIAEPGMTSVIDILLVEDAEADAEDDDNGGE